MTEKHQGSENPQPDWVPYTPGADYAGAAEVVERELEYVKRRRGETSRPADLTGIALSGGGIRRCAPWRAKRGRVVRGRRRRGRMAGVARGPIGPKPAKVICKRIRHAVQPFEVVLRSQRRACEGEAKRHGRRAAGAQ